MDRQRTKSNKATNQSSTFWFFFTSSSWEVWQTITQLPEHEAANVYPVGQRSSKQGVRCWQKLKPGSVDWRAETKLQTTSDYSNWVWGLAAASFPWQVVWGHFWHVSQIRSRPLIVKLGQWVFISRSSDFLRPLAESHPRWRESECEEQEGLYALNSLTRPERLFQPQFPARVSILDRTHTPLYTHCASPNLFMTVAQSCS